MVSVILPSYKSANTIGRAIESICGQSYRDLELIIINEASDDDGTLAIIERYMRQDDRIRLMQNQSKLGIVASLNIGIAAAKGDYVARMDADDYAYPDRFEKQVAFLNKNPDIALCGSDVQMVNNNTGWVITYPHEPEEIKAYAPFINPLAHPSVMARRDFFSDNPYNPEFCTEDYELWLRNIKNVRMANLPEVLLDYHVEGSHLSSSKDSVQSGIDLRRKYLKQLLGVNSESISDIAVMHEYRPDYFINHQDAIVDTCTLYKAATNNNRINKYCDEGELEKALDKLWSEAWDSFLCLKCEKYQIGHTLDWRNSDTEAILRNHINGISVYTNSMKRVVIFGAGNNLRRILQERKYGFEEIYLCDSNKEIQGRKINGLFVLSPDEALKKEYDHILISPIACYENIKKQLIESYKIDSEIIEPLDIIKFRSDIY